MREQEHLSPSNVYRGKATGRSFRAIVEDGERGDYRYDSIVQDSLQSRRRIPSHHSA